MESVSTQSTAVTASCWREKRRVQRPLFRSLS